jgi:hypothetical protein
VPAGSACNSSRFRAYGETGERSGKGSLIAKLLRKSRRTKRLHTNVVLAIIYNKYVSNSSFGSFERLYYLKQIF